MFFLVMCVCDCLFIAAVPIWSQWVGWCLWWMGGAVMSCWRRSSARERSASNSVWSSTCPRPPLRAGHDPAAHLRLSPELCRDLLVYSLDTAGLQCEHAGRERIETTTTRRQTSDFQAEVNCCQESRDVQLYLFLFNGVRWKRRVAHVMILPVVCL